MNTRWNPLCAECFRLLCFVAEALCMGLAITVAIQWITTGTLPGVWDWAAQHPASLLLTGLFYALAVSLPALLTGRLWVGGALISLLGLLLSLIDFFKISINGAPLTLADFSMADQLGAVAGLAGDLTPPLDFFCAAAGLALCVALLGLTRRLTALNCRVRFLALGLGLAAAVLLLTPASARSIGGRFGLEFTTQLDAAVNHQQLGLTLSLWRDAFLQEQPPAEGYGEPYMQQVLSRIDQLLADSAPEAPARSPNIIFLLSEAFFDPTRLPGVTYGEDPVQNFHALEAEGISGRFHSHHLGYGTGNIEISMLTGIRSTDLPTGTDICSMPGGVYDAFDSLAEQYTNAGGYQGEMLHAYTDELYNRTVNYPLMGFGKLMFADDLQALGLPWERHVPDTYYMQDSYFCQALLHELEEINRQGQRAVLYGISMENHQPYNAEKFGNTCQTTVSAEGLAPDETDVLRAAVEGIMRADEALGELTDALREVEAPTIVVFFGDHRPNLTLPDGETIYTKLGLCPGTWTYNWVPDEFNDLYSTDYLIWANDAALLNGQAGTRRDSSVTAIGPDLLELTGQPVSRYWGLMEKCAEVCLTHTSFYFVDGAGRASVSPEEAGLPPEAMELLKLRESVIYDAIYGGQYITADMNSPAGTPPAGGPYTCRHLLPDASAPPLSAYESASG